MAKIKFPQLITNRLLLRKFLIIDSVIVAKLAGVFEIADTTIRIPYLYKEEEAKKWIKRHDDWFVNEQSINWAITLKENKNLIGAISLMNIDKNNNHAELGYWVGKPYWGRGYATESAEALINYGFEVIKFNRFHAHHLSRNSASGKVLLKIGMKREGTLREHIVKWDQFEDIELYGILKSDISK